MYWKHIKDAKARLAKEHPELTKTQVLEMARKEHRSQYSSRKDRLHSVMMIKYSNIHFKLPLALGWFSKVEVTP